MLLSHINNKKDAISKDALSHIARFEHVLEAANKVDEFNEEHSHELKSSPHPESPII